MKTRTRPSIRSPGDGRNPQCDAARPSLRIWRPAVARDARKFCRWRVPIQSVVVFAYALPLLGQVPELKALPDVVIEGEFTRFADLAVGDSGVIAAAEPMDATILFFTADGHPLGRFGRRGAGPGEFLNLDRLGTNGQVFWATDPATKRVTILSSGRKLSETFPIPVRLLDATARQALFSPSVLASGKANRLIVAAGDPSSSEHDPGLVSMGHGGKVLLATTRRGEVIARLATIPPRPDCVVASGAATAIAVPFCADALVAVASDASRVVIIEFDMKNSAYDVRCIRMSGATLFQRRIEFNPVVIPRAVADSVVAARTSHLPPDVARLYRDLSIPRHFPPITRLLLGRDGTTWLEELATDGLHHWTVMGRDGVTVATLTLPRFISIRAAEMKYLWTVATDEDGVESIVTYRLTAAATPR